ncbi:Lrp/AsnC family transcriptional regulator [Roseobacter sp. HKCCA0434]|uniref:Lrp/AsnC family transcriptional regulator n=1 Tax=Roseobacter sp. HKCCA0434 TaxID=3079297 RepID=UPI002905CD1C|nr:Lrp/AsnC family transcriptional regulator [Roseobacter sp. HKCCA0434]
MEFDAQDLKLLTLLQRDGRLTNAALAEAAHLSPSACHRRVRRLEQAGVIAGYGARLDPAAIGRKAVVFVEITLAGQSEEVLDAFEAAIARVPDVVECHLMAGAADYLAKVMAADSEDFARIHRQHLSRLPGVAQMQSSFALRTVRAGRELPLPQTSQSRR